MYKSLILVASILISSCAFIDHRNSKYYAKYQAGENAFNCGSVHDGESTESVDSCVIKNLKNGKSFYAWYWLLPIDSAPAFGLQYTDDNRLFISWYEEGYWAFAADFKPIQCNTWDIDVINEKPIILCDMNDADSASIFGIEHIVRFGKKANKSRHSAN